jgi:hypothetical protein
VVYLEETSREEVYEFLSSACHCRLSGELAPGAAGGHYLRFLPLLPDALEIDYTNSICLTLVSFDEAFPTRHPNPSLSACGIENEAGMW